MKKIFGLSLVLILVVGIIGVATFAYFTDNDNHPEIRSYRVHWTSQLMMPMA